MDSRLRLLVIASGLWVTPLLATIAQAQITPDGTLNTTVNTTGLNTTITNGTAAGTNLYHSFGQFSVPTGGSATFDLNATPSIRTIFSRVTGGNVSNIDGLIRTLNSSNPVSLFLINPAGILFGANARLNIGGSFVATTANSIKFADGTELSAIDPAATPLLTVSVPIGLQIGNNPAPIQVNGPGHSLTLPSILSPVIRNGAPRGLIAALGQTLALVGGDLEFQGGSLSAFGGRVELGAVKDGGFVSLTPVAQGWQLGYSGPQFGEIRLANKSLVDVSSAAGLSAGAIQIRGQNFVVRDGSIVLSQNTGNRAAGMIQVNTSQLVDLSGTAPDRQFNSQIRSESFAQGAAGNIEIQTQKISITSGAIVIGFNFLNSPGGALSIAASDSIETVGTSPRDPLARSGIYAVTVGTKPAANLHVTTGQLIVSGGAQIASSALGSSPGGTGGTATIVATDVSVIGFSPLTDVASAISAGTFGLGNAGNLVINTQRLSVLDGGGLGSTTFAYGNAGNVTINATESVTVSGGFMNRSGGFNPSGINSSALSLDPLLGKQFGLPATPPGNAGTIVISTASLIVDNQAVIGVKADGVGSGGMLQVNADRVLLNHGSALNATTASGEGGNIVVNAQDLLLLRQGSAINATAGGSGNGGNLTINAAIVAGFENSDIIANAVKGRGGNIQITTQGIFGLKFRPQLTPENDITASSEFGVSGNVQISNLTVDPTSGIVQLPVDLVDPSQQIATGCNAQGSRFVATGRGGLPPNPTEQVGSDRPWSDIRPLSQVSQNIAVAPSPLPPAPVPLLEANTMQRNVNGAIELVAHAKAPIAHWITCATSTKE